VKQFTGIYTVVLTGGIASGKTAVSDYLAQLGAAVIDTDLIARELVQPDQPALARIVEEFGTEFLDQGGTLDRRRLREVIFSDPAKKSLLEAILHPLIESEVLRRIRQLNSPYCILVIPLYAESSAYEWIDRVLVVDVSAEVQIERVTSRDGITREQAQSILDSQASRQQRLALADDVLDNSGSLTDLHDAIEKLHRRYLKLSQSSRR
jgi:dephospho-CoA kinase